MIKLNALNCTLMAGNTDLGPQREWCKGFSTHLMLLANKQRKTLASTLKYFSNLRSQVTNLSKLSVDDVAATRHNELWDSANDLKQLLLNTRVCLEQLTIYLQACPTEAQFEGADETYNLAADDLPIVNCKRGDAVWERANGYVRECLGLVADLTSKFDATFPKMHIVYGDNYESDVQDSIMTSEHFDFLTECFGSMNGVKDKMREFAAMLDAPEAGKHPLWENIEHLQNKIASTFDEFNEIGVSLKEESELVIPLNKDNLSKYENDLETLVNMILIVIQNKYKDNLAPELDNADDFERNKLREKLVESIEKDVRTLKLKEIYRSLNGLLKIIYNANSTAVLSYCR